MLKNFNWLEAIVMSVAMLSVFTILVLCNATEKKEKRIRHIAILVAAVFAFTFVSIAAAGAEPAEIEYFVAEKIVGVTAETFDGEVVYRVDFVFHNDVLSWYEDEPIYASRTYVLKIWRGVEVVNSAWL